MVRAFLYLRRAILRAMAHDVLNTAKAVAYSGMLFSFPAIVVLTTALSRVPEGPNLEGEVRSALDQFLPEGSLYLLHSTVETHHLYSPRVVLSAISISLFAGLGLMLSLMEGFRRAYQLPRGEWSYWRRSFRALLLVPIVLVPLSLASLLLVFGQQIEGWMVARAVHELRHVVLFFWRLVRWTLAMSTSITVLAALYHFGTKRGEHWIWVIPGACAATVVWFPATLLFGWYVSRIANYSLFYGSFAAGIATMVWLYLTSFSALLGAELNGVLFRGRRDRLNSRVAAASLQRSL